MNNLILLSLSRVEQKDLFRKTISQYWVGSQYKPLIALVDKLFLSAIEKALGPGEELIKIKSLLNYKSTGASINKKSFIYLVDILNKINGTRPFKGFGLIFMCSINHSISAAEKPNELLCKDTSPEGICIDNYQISESVLTDIMAWLLSNKSVAVAELRLRLLPLDMLPNAFISEINEKALDLTGELALEEVGGDVTISINVLDDVMVNFQSLQLDLNVITN